ncbi:Uncharacterised protein [Mycobacteroides abscessus subsp. abscessus]|nr:Uncharacterised protein [Mycobacteroides abscessus subsp. abscessus]SKV89027.1 Uncharacterised protein [Mycobacteroides abscessus subsp. abscessus]
MLHGVISFQDEPTPICGLTQSSSPMPTARSIPRAAVFSRPSVTSRLRGLISGCCGADMGLSIPRRCKPDRAGVDQSFPGEKRRDETAAKQ